MTFSSSGKLCELLSFPEGYLDVRLTPGDFPL